MKKVKPPGYWTLETCKESALSFGNRWDWAKNSQGTYVAARKNGWLDECCKHMEIKKGKWTLETCKKDALNYQTRSEWHDKSGSAFGVALKNGWLDLCCGHMDQLQKPRGYWTLKTCKEDALKYKSRSEWETHSGSAYGKALTMGWVDQCCGHMERLGNSHLRKLYAFEHPDKSVYVGLTYSYDERYAQHMKRNKILIAKKAQGGQKFIKFDQLYPKDVAATKEQELIEEYRARGWTILNQIRAGGLGGSTLIWDLEACKHDALKYGSKGEWARKSAGAWDAARSNGWIDECCAHMDVRKLRNGTWILEKCEEDARKYSTRGEWKDHSATAYGIAWKSGWLDQCCKHMIQVRVPKGTRTLEDCETDALQYGTRSEWQRNSLPMYKVAARNGWVDQCCAHMKLTRNPQGYWDNKELCWQEGQKFKSRSEWQKKSHAAYKAAARNGWLDQCCQHMAKKKAA